MRELGRKIIRYPCANANAVNNHEFRRSSSTKLLRCLWLVATMFSCLVNLLTTATTATTAKALFTASLGGSSNTMAAATATWSLWTCYMVSGATSSMMMIFWHPTTALLLASSEMGSARRRRSSSLTSSPSLLSVPLSLAAQQQSSFLFRSHPSLSTRMTTVIKTTTTAYIDHSSNSGNGSRRSAVTRACTACSVSCCYADSVSWQPPIALSRTVAAARSHTTGWWRQRQQQHHRRHHHSHWDGPSFINVRGGAHYMSTTSHSGEQDDDNNNKNNGDQSPSSSDWTQQDVTTTTTTTAASTYNKWHQQRRFRGGNNNNNNNSNSHPPRQWLPPVEARRKLIPLVAMFFCILFNYTILRATKDVLMVTAPNSGAEVIPFIKTYLNLPVAIIFTGLYAKMTDSMKLENVFYACLCPFLAFFFLFAWLIYPHWSVLHPHGLIDRYLVPHLPSTFAAPLAILRNWSFAMFYVMAELWGSIFASLFFWGFANEITTVDEAKKYYPFFGLFANVALIISGQYVKWVSNHFMQKNLGPDVDVWEISLKFLMGAVLVSGGILLGTYKYMQDHVVPQAKAAAAGLLVSPPPPPPKTTLSSNKDASDAGVMKTTKKRMTLKESARYMLRSSYIRNLATLVVAHGMCINIVEVSWKAKLKQAFPDPNSYSTFMGNFSSATGVFTLAMMLVGRAILNRFGWKVAALVTPLTIGSTGIIFFAMTLFPGTVSPVAAALGTTPLILAVLIGGAQNILSKSAKYSLFDPCKEMAFIPLDKESKTKGKAAVDVIGNPLGKSGGALVQQILIFTVGTLVAATPYMAVILSAIVLVWYRAAVSLSVEFEQAMEIYNKGGVVDPLADIIDPNSHINSSNKTSGSEQKQ